jgi:predicted enzyme related to lactoylglutathione lyase
MNILGLSSIAVRVHNVEQMLNFYSRAFGVQFRQVETFGIQSQFGDLNGITLKFVPIRDSVDFEGYPVHQLGFEVEDVAATIRAAEAHGGCLEGEIHRDGHRINAAVRDPDGNTVELYANG